MVNFLFRYKYSISIQISFPKPKKQTSIFATRHINKKRKIFHKYSEKEEKEDGM